MTTMISPVTKGHNQLESGLVGYEELLSFLNTHHD